MFISSLNPQPQKVLIIDDVIQNILFLQSSLSDLASIHFATNGPEGLALCDVLKPDLILLDISMPGMDGWEVCTRLKDNPLTSDIPVIFITGNDKPEAEQLALEKGAIDFINKPFDPKICRLRVINQLKLRNQSRVLQQAKQEMTQLVESVPVLITYWDENWNNIFSNDLSGKWFQAFNGTSQNKHITQSLPREVYQRLLSHSEIKHKNSIEFTVSVQTNKQEQHFRVFQSATFNEDILVGSLVTFVDITDAKKAKQALHSEKERLRVTLQSIGDAVIATDTQGYITFINPIAERMTGWRFKDTPPEKIEDVMLLRDADTKKPLLNPLYLALSEQRTVAMALNSELLSHSHQVYAVEDSAAPIRDEKGEIIGAIMVFHDVSEAMALAMKMSHLANYDQLTDLPNRILLQDRLTVAIQTAARQNHKVATLLLDIDNFKYLNDSIGHLLGDQLICKMARRIQQLLPPAFTLARLGGDEFVILMNEIPSIEAALSLASDLVTAMHQPFMLDDKPYNVSASVGVSVYPDDAKDAEELIRHADVAMYSAKQEGRNRFCFFSGDLEESLLQRHALELKLRHAIENDELIVVYQPKFNLKTKNIVGAEALVRMVDENNQLISPVEFIPIAEDSGLIVPLGNQVLLKACTQSAKWLKEGMPISVSVNVAAAQFADPDLEAIIIEVLNQTQLPPHYLELEITETALMGDINETQTKLSVLKGLGINISIDDFGTGYSSLSYLKKFNVDIMKIDMSFVIDMLNNTHDYEIVKTIILLGQSLSLTLIAEGVETEEQAQALMELGCGIGQGYLYSKPLRKKEFMTFLESATKNPNET
ncbi:EAL domain-containing protein [uncultured Psychrosphaera sp.]|uniref:EAL domain-containing protein n=1 Tax=uncultured Psychrosphaera sp. TaxID=1403522 RepID=UPI002603A3C2|nr:EAL domain-containing protein [uncultured Psychrosphaera sp.]